MVTCPIVLSEYNKHMNCVDKFDQNKKSCQIDRKVKKWWHRLFFHFIDAAVVNSHVLYKLQSGSKRGFLQRQLKEFEALNKSPAFLTKTKWCMEYYEQELIKDSKSGTNPP